MIGHAVSHDWLAS